MDGKDKEFSKDLGVYLAGRRQAWMDVIRAVVVVAGAGVLKLAGAVGGTGVLWAGLVVGAIFLIGGAIRLVAVRAVSMEALDGGLEHLLESERLAFLDRNRKFGESDVHVFHFCPSSHRVQAMPRRDGRGAVYDPVGVGMVAMRGGELTYVLKVVDPVAGAVVDTKGGVIKRGDVVDVEVGRQSGGPGGVCAGQEQGAVSIRTRDGSVHLIPFDLSIWPLPEARKRWDALVDGLKGRWEGTGPDIHGIAVCRFCGNTVVVRPGFDFTCPKCGGPISMDEITVESP